MTILRNALSKHQASGQVMWDRGAHRSPTFPWAADQLSTARSPDGLRILVCERGGGVVAELELASGGRAAPMSTMGDEEASRRLGEWAAEHGWGELETKLMAKAGGKVDYEPLLRYSEVMRPGNFEFQNGVWRMEGTMEAPACILDPAGQVMWSREWATRYATCQTIKLHR
jgi:hypothetical protein